MRWTKTDDFPRNSDDGGDDPSTDLRVGCSVEVWISATLDHHENTTTLSDCSHNCSGDPKCTKLGTRNKEKDTIHGTYRFAEGPTPHLVLSLNRHLHYFRVVVTLLFDSPGVLPYLLLFSVGWIRHQGSVLRINCPSQT